ncbi:aldo/keto reductase [Zavarzinia compransoris]|nr:aldo/keto reductase [Zavarzinia compransoris]TDP47287.1 aryl-alcohol dehydrogenase-like predicted oxidoreductase [Zavarzinia compransoris]
MQPIPRARLMVGTAGFGAWIGEARAHDIVGRALALGLRRFDTAASYGAAEAILGAALAGRGTAVGIATKISPEADLDLCRPLPGQILALVERSLHRLRRDRLDLLQWHDPLPPALAGPAFATLADLRRQGLIGAIGLCNHDLAALDAVPDIAGTAPVLLQNQHSLLHSDLTPGLTARCAGRGLAVWAWSPLAGGLLAGRYGVADPRPAGSRAARGGWLPVGDTGPLLPALDALKARHGGGLARAALDWVLATPGVTGAILGPSRPEHLDLIGPADPGGDQERAATTIW